MSMGGFFIHQYVPNIYMIYASFILNNRLLFLLQKLPWLHGYLTKVALMKSPTIKFCWILSWNMVMDLVIYYVQKQPCLIFLVILQVPTYIITCAPIIMIMYGKHWTGINHNPFIYNLYACSSKHFLPTDNYHDYMDE